MVVFELPKKIKPKKKDYKAIEYFIINILNKNKFSKREGTENFIQTLIKQVCFYLLFSGDNLKSIIYGI